MKRVGILFLAVLALVAMVAPVSAQPKVTINGLVDNLVTYTRNLSEVDNNYARTRDQEVLARTRIRPDITGEVGTTKFVLGLEIDSTYGQTGATDGSANVNPGGGPQRFGTTGGFDLNTDISGIIEIKWGYVEFGMPIIPVPTRIRVGAQPWEAQYKLSALAGGDFAGIHMTNQWTPMIKTNLTYAQIEEQATGVSDGFIRGDDFAIIASVEITPFKGLDLRPIFSYANFQGVTNGAARQGRGGVPVAAANFPTGLSTAVSGGFPGNSAGAFPHSAIEDRFTVGLDARWRFGPFSLDPTVFYQFGQRDQVVTARPGMTNAAFNTLRRDAWFADIRGGWQAGPLLLELAGIYTTGNRAKDRIDLNESRIKYYEPISTDTSYYATWAEIWGLGIDYFNIIHATAGGLDPGVAIGYDKYGLIRAGARASYALTPAFTVRAAANANWTAESVDVQNSVITAAAGRTVCGTGIVSACTPQKDSQYLGTELNLGFQWRFAPNVALDVVGAYNFSGHAMGAQTAANANTGAVINARNPQDIQTAVARVRYTF